MSILIVRSSIFLNNKNQVRVYCPFKCLVRIHNQFSKLLSFIESCYSNENYVNHKANGTNLQYLIYFDLKLSKKCRIAGVYHLMLLLHPFQGASYVRCSSTKLSTQEMTWHFSCSCTSKQSS